MILNEDYFKDLEIEDEDIAVDDTLDVDEPNHDLTLEEVKELPKQYNQVIKFQIYVDKSRDNSTTFTQTILLPKLFKRLDTIFELYDIVHSEYVLSSWNVDVCNTIAKYGDYQLLCDKTEQDEFTNNSYYYSFFINVYVNYPEFNNYKRAFRFLYTVLNLYRNYKQMAWMSFEPITTNDYVIQLKFWIESKHIGFHYYNAKAKVSGNDMNLSKELTEEYKIEFYNSVIRHFFGEKANKIDYGAIDRNVPIKPIKHIMFK